MVRRNAQRYFFTVLILFSGLFSCFSDVYAVATFQFSEVCYSVPGLDDNKEWIEVYNASEEPVDMTGWRLLENDTKHKLFVTQGLFIVDSGAYFVIAENANTFLNDHPEYTGIVLDSVFSLRDDAKKNDPIVLIDATGDKVDTFDHTKYIDIGEEGYSLEYRENEWLKSCEFGGSPGTKNEECVAPDETDEGVDEDIDEKDEEKDEGKGENKSSPKTVRITELLPDPMDVSDKKGEFVEVYNYGDEKIDLSEWKIDKKSLDGELDAGKYKAFYSITNLTDSKDTVIIDGPFGEVERISYEDAPNGKSYAFDGKEWQWTPIVTPNKPNAFPKAASGAKVRLNEILPNPEGDESGEFIELYNAGKQDVDLQFWSLRDKSKAYTFSEKTIIKPKTYFVVKKEIFTFAINNSDEEISLLDPAGNIVNVMSFQKSKEGVSLGYDGESWRACRSLTPGEENIFNNAPGAKSVNVPKKAYKDIYAYFSVKTKDGDGDETKVRWEFGDGRKSYKKKTKHKYTETGTYTVTMKLDDGKEETKKKFTVKVKKYPKEKVKIRGVMPNPEGKDAEGEYITLKNFEDKSIDLEGWSIATGRNSKKLVNHPITKSFVILAKEERKITREESKFTLGNKKSRIELRYPNGKLAYKVKYKREDGVEEDELYTKEDGEWIWEKGTDETESVTVQPSQEEEILLILPEDIIGRVTEREDILLEVVRTWNGESQVLGAKTYRLEKQGSRYIFTRALSEEHYIKPVLRKVREQFRRI